MRKSPDAKKASHPYTTFNDVESTISDEELQATKALDGVLNDVRLSLDLNEILTTILEGEADQKEFRRILIRNLNLINNPEDAYCLTPIHIAVLCKQPIYLKEILRLKGVDINARSLNGFTALAFACDAKSYILVEILMQHKDIDINIKDIDNICPLQIALERFDLELIYLLLRRTTSKETRKDLPRIYIIRQSNDESLYTYLNYYKNNSKVSPREAVEVGKLLFLHGEKLSNVYRMFKKNCRMYLARQQLTTIGPLLNTIICRNPEILLFFLQNLQKALTPTDLQFIWKFHQKCINQQLHKSRDNNNIEYINGSRISKILFGFVKMYEGILNEDIPLCKTFVGGKRL